MGVHIEKVGLPGIGIRHDLVTDAGRRLSVVSHRDGTHDLGFSDAIDPDAVLESVPLTESEASALANLLGASIMMSRLERLSDAEGIYTEKLELPTDSPFLGGTLGDTRARTRTGVSIVAIVRDGRVVASPTPAETLRAGDKLVAVGTREGLQRIARLIATGSI